MKRAKPCGGCPWLKENQTPAAVAASPVDGRGVHWFSKENIARHWQAASEIGAMLPCHQTDVEAPLYGGSPAKKNKPHICVGLTTLAYRELMLFMMSGQEFSRYSAVPGRRFKAVGLAAWAARLFFAGAVFTMGGRGFKMPKVDQDDPRCGVPWRGHASAQPDAQNEGRRTSR